MRMLSFHVANYATDFKCNKYNRTEISIIIQILAQICHCPVIILVGNMPCEEKYI